MGNEPPEGLTHAEQRELDVLRRRAYGPDADISGDAAAIARLATLETLGRPARALEDVAPQPAERPSPAPQPAERPSPAPLAPVVAAAAPRRAAWHTALIVGTAALALLLGGTAWNQETAGPTTAEPGAADPTVPEASSSVNAERDAAYVIAYREYIDGLRDEVIALAEGDPVVDRLIHERVDPYGVLYGRTVGAGPTTAREHCMIIADLPDPAIACLSSDADRAVSVTLPAWYADAESDVFTGLGEPITYTLTTQGTVVAYPADTRLPAEQIPAFPTPTATPPPGWN